MRLLKDEISLNTFFYTLQKKPSLLFLDYDGTLSPFKIDPLEATPYPGVMELIGKIMQEGKTKVVIVSGRAMQDLIPLISMVPLPELWGSHGGERLKTNGNYSQIDLSSEQKE